MFRFNLILINCIALLWGGYLFAQTPQYVGVMKCKMCHNKESMGDQYKIWLGTAHSNAWETLAGDKALEIGKTLNIENPQTEPKCLKCHSTAAANDISLRAGITVEEGVSCESCHGPGSMYKSMSIMSNFELAVKNGLIIPKEKVCLKCHNQESPTYKPFKFIEFRAKIAHPIPK